MNAEPRLQVRFYRTAAAGNEPVREWLKALPPEERKIIGHDLKTAQYGWPLGMPLIRKLEPGLWEVRSRLDDRIARVIITVEGDTMVLLHGLIKKRRKCRRKTCNLPDNACGPYMRNYERATFG